MDDACMQNVMEREAIMSAQILVVEDEREIADLLVLYLERAGFDVARATTVQDAIRMHSSSLISCCSTLVYLAATGSTCSPR